MIKKNKLKLQHPNTRTSQITEPEDISIVMAVYNHEDTVAEALESALMQEMPYTSVIYCLNDASTDKSAKILNEYSNRYPNKIRVYTSPENLGSSKKSIQYHQPPVNGRYWCLLEGDDYWTTRDKLAKQISFLDSCDSEYVGCSCNTMMKNEITGEVAIIKPDRNAWNLLDLITLAGSYAFYVHTSSLVWRNIYQDRGSFLPPFFNKRDVRGDVMLMHMMLYKGGRIQNIPEVMSCYRVTGRGIWTVKSQEEQVAANRRLVEKLNYFLPLKYKILASLTKLKRRLKRN